MQRLKVWLANSPIPATTIVGSLSAFFVNSAAAQTGATGQPLTSPISSVGGLLQFLCIVVGWFFWFVIAISVLMMMWAAYTYVTAGDDTEKTSKARKIITYGAIGVVVALIANGFPALVDSFFSGSSSNFSNAYC